MRMYFYCWSRLLWHRGDQRIADDATVSDFLPAIETRWSRISSSFSNLKLSFVWSWFYIFVYVRIVPNATKCSYTPLIYQLSRYIRIIFFVFLATMALIFLLRAFGSFKSNFMESDFCYMTIAFFFFLILHYSYWIRVSGLTYKEHNYTRLLSSSQKTLWSQYHSLLILFFLFFSFVQLCARRNLRFIISKRIPSMTKTFWDKWMWFLFDSRGGSDNTRPAFLVATLSAPNYNFKGGNTEGKSQQTH